MKERRSRNPWPTKTTISNKTRLPSRRSACSPCKEHNQLAETLKTTLKRILETGCIVKDLDIGLLDFPAIIDNQDVYLCWKLGEDRIRFYHRQDEGFAGRKPLNPQDLGPGDTVQ